MATYAWMLQEGGTIQFRPRGNSMVPLVKSGQLCTVEPLGDHVVQKGDIVLCKVKGKYFLHLVKSTQEKMDGGGRYQIGNNKGHTNGTIGRDKIFGRLVKVED
jgi:hypothetical protein